MPLPGGRPSRPGGGPLALKASRLLAMTAARQVWARPLSAECARPLPPACASCFFKTRRCRRPWTKRFDEGHPAPEAGEGPGGPHAGSGLFCGAPSRLLAARPWPHPYLPLTRGPAEVALLSPLLGACTHAGDGASAVPVAREAGRQPARLGGMWNTAQVGSGRAWGGAGKGDTAGSVGAGPGPGRWTHRSVSSGSLGLGAAETMPAERGTCFAEVALGGGVFRGSLPPSDGTQPGSMATRVGSGPCLCAAPWRLRAGLGCGCAGPGCSAVAVPCMTASFQEL